LDPLASDGDASDRWTVEIAASNAWRSNSGILSRRDTQRFFLRLIRSRSRNPLPK
jgi:hypothetical protein